MLTFIAQPPSSQYSSSDFVINGGALIAIIIMVVGSLSAAVTFLYKAQSASHDKAIADMKATHAEHLRDQEIANTKLIASKDQTLAQQQQTIERLSARVDTLLSTINHKEQLTLELATGAVQASKDGLEQLTNFVAEQSALIKAQTSSYDTMIATGERQHQRLVGLLTIIAHKLGAQVILGTDLEGSPNDADRRSDPLIR